MPFPRGFTGLRRFALTPPEGGPSARTPGGPRADLLGAGLALLAFAILSFHDAIIKSLGAHYSPVQIVFFSALFGFPLVSIALLNDRTSGTLRPKRPFWVLLRTMCVLVTGVANFYAFTVLPIAQTYALLFASPLLISVLAVPLLGESIGWRRRVAVFVGLAGVLIVLRPGMAEFSLGHAAALTGAATGALSSIVVRKIGGLERPVILMLYPMIANFLLLGAALPYFYKPMPIEHLLLIAAVSVLAAAGSFLIILAYRRAEAVIVATMQYSQMIWAIALGALFFAERIDAFTLVGGGVVILSGCYVVMREKQKRRDPQSLRP